MPTVKSAIRVLEVFEYFDRVQREASVTEIARELGYPQSSTSVLLRNLADLGYLRHGADQRSYFPTPRVAMLGSWVEPMVAPGGSLRQLMGELGELTGETIILATPLRDQVQYVHVVPATTTASLRTRSRSGGRVSRGVGDPCSRPAKPSAGCAAARSASGT